MKRSVQKNKQAGFATVLALSILALAVIIGGALMLLMPQVEATGERYASTMTAKNAAEAGFRRAVAEMRYAAAKNNMVWADSNWIDDGTGKLVAVDGNGSTTATTENGKAYYSVTVKEVKMKYDASTNKAVLDGNAYRYDTNGSLKAHNAVSNTNQNSYYYQIISTGQYKRQNDTEYATVFGYVTLDGDGTSGYDASEWKTSPATEVDIGDRLKQLEEEIQNKAKSEINTFTHNYWSGNGNDYYGYILVECSEGDRKSRLTFSSKQMYDVVYGKFLSDFAAHGGKPQYTQTGRDYNECYVEFDSDDNNPLYVGRKTNRDWWWNMYQLNTFAGDPYTDDNGNQITPVKFTYAASYGRYDNDFGWDGYYGSKTVETTRTEKVKDEGEISGNSLNWIKSGDRWQNEKWTAKWTCSFCGTENTFTTSTDPEQGPGGGQQSQTSYQCKNYGHEVEREIKETKNISEKMPRRQYPDYFPDKWTGEEMPEIALPIAEPDAVNKVKVNRDFVAYVRGITGADIKEYTATNISISDGKISPSIKWTDDYDIGNAEPLYDS